MASRRSCRTSAPVAQKPAGLPEIVVQLFCAVCQECHTFLGAGVVRPSGGMLERSTTRFSLAASTDSRLSRLRVAQGLVPVIMTCASWSANLRAVTMSCRYPAFAEPCAAAINQPAEVGNQVRV